MRKPTLIGLMLVSAAVAAGAWYAHREGWWPTAQAPATGAKPTAGNPRAARRERPVPVLTSRATRRDVDVTIDALGTVSARSTVAVKPRVDGLLVRLAFIEGQPIRKGALLAELDARPFEVALAQVRGQLARDQAQLANARTDLARYRGLLSKDSIARQQVDTQASLVRQLEGTVAVGRAAVRSAELQLDYTKITAPISGRVGLKQVDVGNIVRAGDPNPIVVITEEQPINVVFSVPSERIAEVAAALRASQAPTVVVFDRGGVREIARGVLASLDNRIDPATGTVRLKAEFPNRDQSLFPNQFVSVRLWVRRIAGALTIPAAAMLQGGNGPYVFVAADDGTARVRGVRPGRTIGDRVVIEEGLSESERVVVDGVDRIRDGRRIEAVDAARASGTAAGAATAPTRPGKR
ncbi:MAG: MdtA/MuxA family multidrug efflux RND transporter periplasmic adaptor subunit [Burkholderiaceae bacterium]